jgi:hypothetical protein
MRAFHRLYEFLMAKMNEQMWPSLDTRGKGGGWFEGENYGNASKRHLCDTLLLLKQTTGQDLFNNPAHPFPRQSLYYEFYSIQPGDASLYPGGDQPAIAQAPVRGYNRDLLLTIAEGMKGTVESEYAQYWCNHVETNMDDIEVMIAFDFLLYHPEYPERNHKTSLPTSYLAEGAGWVHSRSDWSSTATSVVMVSTDRIEGHQHRDQNAFVIYKGSDPARATSLGDDRRHPVLEQRGRRHLGAQHHHRRQHRAALRKRYGKDSQIRRRAGLRVRGG